MKTKSFLTLLSICLLFLLPLSLCAQEPVCGKCLKKKSNCPYSCNHPTCKTCGRVCGAKNNPCPYGGKHPKCNACGKLRENCSYGGNHPTCSSCGRVCGAKNNPCPYGGNHPKCNTCGQLRENCSYGGNHPTCNTCGKVCGASSNPCPYGGNHPKCNTCGQLRENCSYGGNHPTCSSCGKVCGAKNNPCPYGGNHPATGTHAGHEYVDMGLSVKWATCNVGASSPSGYGNYYAWGETSTKSKYRSSNCKTWERSMSDIGGNSSYDAARANWGGSWRLPTKAEFDELRKNCNCQWATQNGVAGVRFTSKRNGNSVFFPAAGWRTGTSTDFVGKIGFCWSSTPYESNAQQAYDLFFDSGGSASTVWYNRYLGQPVRPVVE